MRAPYNVLVLPYFFKDQQVQFCVFLREDMRIWQFIAGGGEDGETIIESAKRESFEEAGVSDKLLYRQLESMCYVASSYFSQKARQHWGQKYVIPVYVFAVELESERVSISDEHTEHRWCTYEEAINLLHFDLDKTALYELRERIADDQWNL